MNFRISDHERQVLQKKLDRKMSPLKHGYLNLSDTYPKTLLFVVYFVSNDHCLHITFSPKTKRASHHNGHNTGNLVTTFVYLLKILMALSLGNNSDKKEPLHTPESLD